MVRGISKQVVMVEGGRTDFFEDAIFILKEDCIKEGIKEKDLLRQAKGALTDMDQSGKSVVGWKGVLWALAGFSISSGIWLLTALL